jgi:EmrB/QacA subfamily drug resistance transporter
MTITGALTIDARERRIALIGVFLCIFLGALDQTIVSTALPRIVQDLGGTNLYAWVATSYLLASTVALPIAGRLADLVSPKYILVVAATVFLVGSALSGLSHNMDQLIIFRGVQGLGGGAIFAVASTVIGLMFPPRERGRVQGLFGAVFGLASVVGPYLGGQLTVSFSWRYVFYVNMPFGALALYVLLVHMPLLRAPHRQRFDTGGVVTLILWTVPLLLALSWAGTTYAWLSPQILGLFALTVVALTAFYLLERQSPAPLFHMDLLRIPTFTWAGLGTLFFGASFLGSVLFLPFYLVMAKNISPLNAGLTLTPLTAGVVVGSMASGMLASRLGRVKGLLVIGSLWATAVFFLVYATLATTTPMWHLIVLMVLLGIGIGPGFPLYTLAVQNVVRMDQMGVASSGNQFFRQIGSSIGAAVMGVLLVSTLSAQIPAHLPPSLRGHAAGVSVNENAIADQSQTKAAIMAQFRRVANQLDAALGGNLRAYRALMANPELPAAYRRQLVPGGIPAEVRAGTARTLSLLGAALRGNHAAKAALLADPSLPASVKGLAAHPPASPAAQAAVLGQVQAALRTAEPATIRHLEASVLPTVRRDVMATGRQTADAVVRAIVIGITDAVKRVFGMAGLLAAAATAISLLLPNLELRRRHHGSEPDRAGSADLLRLALVATLVARRGADPDADEGERRRLRRALALLAWALAERTDDSRGDDEAVPEAVRGE